MRHGAHSLAAPPGRLGIGGNADRARDVSGISVARLHQVMVMTGREEDDLLALRRLDNSPDIGGDLCPPRQHPEVHRLQAGEQRVVALDRHRRLPGCDLVAVVEGMHPQLGEVL